MAISCLRRRIKNYANFRTGAVILKNRVMWHKIAILCVFDFFFCGRLEGPMKKMELYGRERKEIEKNIGQIKFYPLRKMC